MVHRPVLLELANHAGDTGGLLTDRHVDALNATAALVDDGVNRHSRLAGLAVADDQLSLASTNGDHGIDGLEAGLDRLRHRLPGDDARGNLLDRRGLLGLDGPLAVKRIAERAHDPPQQLGTHRHLKDAPGTAHGVTLGDMGVVAHHHGAHRVPLEVERQSVDPAREFQHFTGHGAGQPIDTAYAVGDADHRSLVTSLGNDIEILDPLLDQVADFRWIELHHATSVSEPLRWQAGPVARGQTRR